MISISMSTIKFQKLNSNTIFILKIKCWPIWSGFKKLFGHISPLKIFRQCKVGINLICVLENILSNINYFLLRETRQLHYLIKYLHFSLITLSLILEIRGNSLEFLISLLHNNNIFMDLSHKVIQSIISLPSFLASDWFLVGLTT